MLRQINMNGTVLIDCFPESVENYAKEFAIVAIDVIRATTTAVTGVSMGRRCFPVDSLEAAQELAPKLHNPLLVGELGGDVPSGFDMNNSPAELALRIDISRPMIEAGYVPANDQTGEIVERWRDSPPEACLNGNSANYLRRSGQLKDLDFILSHINDLDGAFVLGNNEIIEIFDEATATGRAKGSLSNLVEAR